jgi:hypothetical protein
MHLFSGGPIMATLQANTYTLTLSEEERSELLRILESSLVETHAERRRTESPSYQGAVEREESLLRNLTEKVRKLGR